MHIYIPEGVIIDGVINPVVVFDGVIDVHTGPVYDATVLSECITTKL